MTAIVHDTRQLIFAGVNFVFAPGAEVTQERQLAFQTQLVNRQMEFDQSRRDGNQIILLRTLGSHLQIQVLGGGTPVGQLLVIAERPVHTLDLIKKEMDEVVAAFEGCWGQPQQIVARDATIRLLFATDGGHAFQYLWEDRLGQSDTDLSALGRPVQGGGLRFVMPPIGEKFQIELKVESFLTDSSKLFLETQFVWPQPETAGSRMHPDKTLDQVYQYATGPALAFALGNENGRSR